MKRFRHPRRQPAAGPVISSDDPNRANRLA
jgi:hypothetical protein